MTIITKEQLQAAGFTALEQMGNYTIVGEDDRPITMFMPTEELAWSTALAVIAVFSNYVLSELEANANETQ